MRMPTTMHEYIDRHDRERERYRHTLFTILINFSLGSCNGKHFQQQTTTTTTTTATTTNSHFTALILCAFLLFLNKKCMYLLRNLIYFFIPKKQTRFFALRKLLYFP